MHKSIYKFLSVVSAYAASLCDLGLTIAVIVVFVLVGVS